METKQIAAVAVVAILVIAAVGVYFVMSGEDSGYRSTNTDCRLQILGNADENDYLDSDDITKIKEMITNNEYTQIADANNDGKLDQKDVDKVQEILDAKEYNVGKAQDAKKKVTVNYISVDQDVKSATYPFGNIVIVNSQRALEIAIALGVEDRVVGMSNNSSYWDDNEYAGCEDIPIIGERKEPNLEEILKLDADTIYTGNLKNTCVNVSGDNVGDKQVVRLATWENGGLENGALMLGFFMDVDKRAEEYVKWMDDLNKEIQDILAKIPNKSATKFMAMSSAKSMAVQKDGVSTALTRTGATNIGNSIVVDPPTSYGTATNFKEEIAAANTPLIILAVYIMSQNDQAWLDNKYNGYDWSNSFGATDAYKNGNIVMIDYGMPFCLITLIGAYIMFEDSFSTEYVTEKIQEYMDEFTNVPDGFEVNLNNCVYKP